MDLGFEAFDADNLYYETLDAFTRDGDGERDGFDDEVRGIMRDNVFELLGPEPV